MLGLGLLAQNLLPVFPFLCLKNLCVCAVQNVNARVSNAETQLVVDLGTGLFARLFGRWGGSSAAILATFGVARGR